MGDLLREISPLRIAFGGASVSGEGGGYAFGEISEANALSLLREAKGAGIKVFDTAPIYGFGLSEQRIGKAFVSVRDEVFVVSKSGVTWHSNKRVDMTNDPKVTQSMLEQSLRDLQSDYIDLYMIHWPDPMVDIRRPMEVLAKAKLEGKIKHIGLCNTNLMDLDLAGEVEQIEVVQSQFNIFDRSVMPDLFKYLSEKEISFMSWGTLDKGIISGSIDKKREQSKGYDTSDCRKSAPWWKQSEVIEKIERMQRVWPILRKYEHTGLELALGHNLRHPEVSMALLGMKTPSHIEKALASLEHLPAAHVIDECLEALA